MEEIINYMDINPLFFICCNTFRRRHHPSSHRSSSFTLLQSLAIEDSRDKPAYSVLLGQLFAFIGTTPDQAVNNLLTLLTCEHATSELEYCGDSKKLVKSVGFQ